MVCSLKTRKTAEEGAYRLLLSVTLQRIEGMSACLYASYVLQCVVKEPCMRADLCRKGNLLEYLLEIFMLYLRITREGLN